MGATRVMIGSPVQPATIQPTEMDYICTKVPMFSFGRLKNSDPRLGVEMQSTGEVACFGVNQYDAFLKAMLAAGFKLPTKNILICIGPSQQKIEFLQYAQMLVSMGFNLYATKNTHEILANNGVRVQECRDALLSTCLWSSYRMGLSTQVHTPAVSGSCNSSGS